MGAFSLIQCQIRRITLKLKNLQVFEISVVSILHNTQTQKKSVIERNNPTVFFIRTTNGIIRVWNGTVLKKA